MSEPFINRPTWLKSIWIISHLIIIQSKISSDGFGIYGNRQSRRLRARSVSCARRLEAEGIDWFGVALAEEGLELRESGIKTPILCLGSFWSDRKTLCWKTNNARHLPDRNGGILNSGGRKKFNRRLSR
jgi:hypothetical protein